MKFNLSQLLNVRMGPILFLLLMSSIGWMLFSSYSTVLAQPNENFTATTFHYQADVNADLNQVMQSDAWSLEKPNEPRWNRTRIANWLKIEVMSRVDYPLQIHTFIDNPTLDLIDFFVIDEFGETNTRRFIGDSRSLPGSSDYSIPKVTFEIPPFAQETIYIHVRTRQGGAIPLVVYGDLQAKELTESLLILWGGFLGLSLIMILYYLSLFRAMREPIYMAYAVFTIATLVYLSQLYGFGYHIFPIPMQRFMSSYLGSTGLLLMQAIFMFSRNFVTIERKNENIKVTRLMPTVLTVLVVLSFFLPNRVALSVSLGVQPFLFGYLVKLIIDSFKDKQHWIQFYLMSWLPVFVGLPVTSLAYLDWIESTFITRYAFFISIVAQLALTALSFSERMKFTEARRIYQATHDRYTQLPNRSALTQAINRWKLNQQEFSLVFIEVGTFLRFLPYVGAERAAMLIAQVGKQIRLFWREKGDSLSNVKSVNFIPPYLVRDHVLAIIVDTKVVQEAMAELYRFCDQELEIAGIEIRVNPVISAVNYPAHSREADELIQKAMQALDYAKKESLPYALYFEAQVQHSEQEIRIATDLRKAIENNELELYHQPQIYLKDFSVYGSEVLLRWIHPDAGFIPPDVFVKVAEDIGMINDLTRWVVERAFSQQKQLNERGFRHQVSINISGKDVNDPNFFQTVKSLLKKYELEGQFVTLELTESVTVKDKRALKALMKRFENIGIHFSIDDFGTGFSSLEALSELSFSELKIDRAFVQDMIESDRNYTISSATIDLANRLDLDTVAEGVENESIIFKLKGCNCRIGQGYYFSKPLPFVEYLDWLQKGG